MSTTPARLHLIHNQVNAPFWRLSLNSFFHDTNPSEWLAETFAETMGGDDCTMFLDGIKLAGRKSWKLSTHFQKLYAYYTSKAGRAQLAQLSQKDITQRMLGTAVQRLLADHFEDIANQPQGASSSSSRPAPLPPKRRALPPQNVSTSSSRPPVLPSKRQPPPPQESSSSSSRSPLSPSTPKQSGEVSSRNIHRFFKERPTTHWLDYREFIRYTLDRDPNSGSGSCYKIYMKNLRYIAMHETWVRTALDTWNIRESAFKTEYLSVQGEMMRKRRRIDDTDHDAEYDVLWEDLPLSSSSSDQDFVQGSQASSEGSTEEDITGEIPLPQGADRFVGPGTLTSQLYCDFSSHIQVEGYDINQLLMTYRRVHVIQSDAKSMCQRDELLSNFVVTKELLVHVLPSNISAAAVEEVFPDVEPRSISNKERKFLASLCARTSLCDFNAIQRWFEKQQSVQDSIVFRAVTNFLSEPNLWSPINWYTAKGDNEDTFTDALLRPLLSATFGKFAGSMFRWTRDPLKTAKVAIDSPPEYPNYQVSFNNQAYVLGEFKTPTASSIEMDKDWKKLVFMGKKAVDNLYKEGVQVQVVLLHGRGLDLSVHTIELASEAFYKVSDMGTFRLISSPREFGLMLSIGPLYHAQTIAAMSHNAIKDGVQVPTDRTWMRGTFDVKEVNLP